MTVTIKAREEARLAARTYFVAESAKPLRDQKCKECGGPLHILLKCMVVIVSPQQAFCISCLHNTGITKFQ